MRSSGPEAWRDDGVDGVVRLVRHGNSEARDVDEVFPPLRLIKRADCNALEGLSA